MAKPRFEWCLSPKLIPLAFDAVARATATATSVQTAGGGPVLLADRVHSPPQGFGDMRSGLSLILPVTGLAFKPQVVMSQVASGNRSSSPLSSSNSGWYLGDVSQQQYKLCRQIKPSALQWDLASSVSSCA